MNEATLKSALMTLDIHWSYCKKYKAEHREYYWEQKAYYEGLKQALEMVISENWSNSKVIIRDDTDHHAVYRLEA